MGSQRVRHDWTTSIHSLMWAGGKHKMVPKMHNLLSMRALFPKKHFTLGFIFSMKWRIWGWNKEALPSGPPAVRGKEGRWYPILTGNPGIGPALGSNANCLEAQQGMPFPQGRKEPDSPVQIQTTLGAPTCSISAISQHPGRHYHHRVCSLQINRLSWSRLGKDPLCLRRITQLCICSHSTYASHSCAQLHRLWSSGPQKTKHHLAFPFSPKALGSLC